MADRTRKQVFVIGLDSAAPALVERWAGEGKLPVFKRLMETGCYGRLESTAPALTPPAWTTSVTGVNPGKHNIYDFFRVTPEHGKEIVSSNDRGSKAIWNLLDEFGGRSIILNLPITYPAEEFNGIMITGMPTPNVNKGFVSPANIRDEILRLTNGRQLAVDPHKLMRGEEHEFLQDLEAVTDLISRLTTHLINGSDWDFFMVVFDDLDRLQHTFWHHMDPNHTFYDKEKAQIYQDAILHFYQFLEEKIEDIISMLDEETVIMIFSDHGMGPVYRNFHINNFFEERGWLKSKKPLFSMKEILRSMGLSLERMKLFLDSSGMRVLARRLLPPGVKNYVRKNLPAEGIELEIIDWSKTLDWSNSLAYLSSRTGQGIMINRDNVEDYEAFREEIIESLLNLKDPETGRHVVKRVYKKEELFQGPYLNNAPDMLLEPAETYELQEKLGASVFQDVNVSRVPISANHQKEGILLLFSKRDLHQGHNLSDVKIADIAPTVLCALGFSVPRDMDGRVIVEAFDEAFLKNSPVRYSDISLNMESASESMTSTDEAKVADRLRDLGYID
ncbi:MAG: alkaline phosphatase family protein [Deltaproteobacteria bacterium]|nr:alkaline phosphatase family protein [Deltaproteobacteria bacterium]